MNIKRGPISISFLLAALIIGASACLVLASGRSASALAGPSIASQAPADGDNLHPLQRAFIEHHGLQCGFCTPGFLMLAANVLEQRPEIDDEELLDVLASNLCRCTGYQNIIKAVRAARHEMRASRAAE